MLGWTEHFNYVLKRISQRLFLLRTLRPIVSHVDLHLVFNSLICSVVEYAAPLFCLPDKHIITLLERFYNRCFNIMNCNMCACFSETCKLSLTERFKLLTLNFLRKVENPVNRINYVLPKRLKFTGNFNIPHHCTTRRQNCFSVKAALLYNNDF